MKFFIFLIALFFTTLLTLIWLPISIFYHLITLKFIRGFKAIGEYFYQLAIVIDIFANESLQTPLNWLMINKNGDRFGNNDRELISYVIATNKAKEKLTKFGTFWAKLLNKIDPKHLEKSLEVKIKRDTLAIKRLEENSYLLKKLKAQK